MRIPEFTAEAGWNTSRSTHAIRARDDRGGTFGRESIHPALPSLDLSGGRCGPLETWVKTGTRCVALDFNNRDCYIKPGVGRVCVPGCLRYEDVGECRQPVPLERPVGRVR
jgi:hypothetical protein